jgi:hypothetical protein
MASINASTNGIDSDVWLSMRLPLSSNDKHGSLGMLHHTRRHAAEEKPINAA